MRVITLKEYSCPNDWGGECYRIHRLHLCRGVKKTNESPGYDIKPSDGEVPVLGNVKYPSIAITPRSTLKRSGIT